MCMSMSMSYVCTPQYKQYVRIYTHKYEVKKAVDFCFHMWHKDTYLREIAEEEARHTSLIISTAALLAVQR